MKKETGQAARSALPNPDARAAGLRMQAAGSPWLIRLALFCGGAALVLLALPWFRLELSGYHLRSGALQILLRDIALNGTLVSYPLAVKLCLGIAGLALLLGLILAGKRFWMLAGGAGLSALTALLCLLPAFVPLNGRLAQAAGLTPGIKEQAYRLEGGLAGAVVLTLIFALLMFIRHSGESFFAQFFRLAALLSIAMVFLITFYLLWLGLPAMLEIGPLNFLFGTTWAPTHAQTPSFGILYMILASLFATAGAVLIGVPVGLLTAVFLAELAPPWLHALVRPAVELLAGIPSVIYGFFALQMIVPWVQKLFLLPSGATLFSAILVLAIMILPTIITTAETGLRALPVSYKEASLALGASHIRTIFKIQLPAARSTLLSGVILGVGRAIGETMAIIMVAGGTASFPKLLGSVRPLTVGIVMEMSYASGLHRDALFAIGLVLFVFIMLVNISFTKLSGKGRAGHE